MKVLIVDDREENCYLLETLLSAQGHAVHSASNGAEALDLLRSDGFDLIISDILMPVMDGFELCRRVKEDKTLQHISFIVYTATYTGDQDEVFATKIGADRFIRKPCEPDELMKVIQDVMRSRKGSNTPDVKDQPKEEEILKLYNERLVRKLEQKMMELETEAKALREAQESLRVSESKYRRLHESMTDGFVFVDMQGRIRESNESYRRMLGYTEQELFPLTYVDLTPEEWHAYERDVVSDQILKKDSSDVYEKEYRKKDGVVIPVELRTFLIRNDQGEPEGMWAIVRDISDRKQTEKTQTELEALLHQAQKMESVGRLAGGVAHDFNNLLSIILGYGENVMETLGVDHPCYESIQEIQQAGIRAQDLTRQLLAFSRKQLLEMKPVDVNSVVRGFDKLLRRLIGEDIRVKLDLSDEQLIVKADITQLEQVLMNLSVNARDAMPNGGILTIQTQRVEMDEVNVSEELNFLSGVYVLLGVRDTGSGMDKQTLDQIFEPFFTTKCMDRGTGLGLATSYGIIKQHGGTIRVESKPGSGSLFKIYLPMSFEEAPVFNPLTNLSNDVRIASATVLIIEDDLPVKKLVSQILVRKGYNVIESDDVHDAIRKAAECKDPIHLVLADVIMPGMEGPEVYKQIQAYQPKAKVLYMSGYADDVIASHGVLRSDIQFVQKPFTSKSLLEKCRQILKDGI